MARRRHTTRNLLVESGVVGALILAVGSFVLYGSSGKTLPPTSFSANHLETLPQQQINTVPIPILIQEHMMEHVPPSEEPGVLVQYNCDDYLCAPDLVSNLEPLNRDSSRTVFLAPFPRMDAKIALAAPGKLEILDSFDDAKIRDFIQKNLA